MSNAVILTSDGSNLTAEEDHAVKTFADMTGVELDLREIDLLRHGWMLNRIRSCERILEPPPDSSDYGVEVTRLPISRADFIFYNLELASNSEWVITVDKASAQLLQSVFPVLTDLPFSTALHNAVHDSRVNVLDYREFERNLPQSGLFVRAQSVRGSCNMNICFSDQPLPRDLEAECFESVEGYWNRPQDDETYEPEGSIGNNTPGAYIRVSEGEAEDPRIYGQWPSRRSWGGDIDEQAHSESEEASLPEGFIEDDAAGDAPDTYIEDSEGEAEAPWPYAQLSSPRESDGNFDEPSHSDTSEDNSADEEHRAMLARPRRVHTIFDDLA
jgi:hypothetical protein